MSRPVASKAVRCNWKRRKGDAMRVWDCTRCGCWTANFPLYRYDVCSQKDRRKGRSDRRAR